MVHGQALLDEHVAQTYAVAAAGTSRADGEVHAAQVEDGRKVHVHRRVHRLEDDAVAQHRRVVLLVHDLGGFDDGLRRRVVAEDATHLVLTQVRVVHTGLGEGLTAGHVGILCFLGHRIAVLAMEIGLDVGDIDKAMTDYDIDYKASSYDELYDILKSWAS